MTDWHRLEETCRHCQLCALADTRKNVVFGSGNPNAKVLFVGDVPGWEEDISGQAFVGSVGKLLDDMLSVVDLDRRSNIYISTIIKCFPPHNRLPLSSEQRACLNYLRHQVLLMQPKIIVCLGDVASRLIHPDFSLEDAHGIFQEKAGIAMVGLYHPSKLLANPSYKPDLFQDLKQLQGKIKELSPETYENVSI